MKLSIISYNSTVAVYMDKVENILERMKELGGYKNQAALASALEVSSSALTISKENNSLSNRLIKRFCELHPKTDMLYLEWGIKEQPSSINQKYIDYAGLIQEYDNDIDFINNTLKPVHLNQESILKKILFENYRMVVDAGFGRKGVKGLTKDEKQWFISNLDKTFLTIGYCFGKKQNCNTCCLKCPYFLTTTDFIPVLLFIQDKMERLGSYFLENNVSDSNILLDQNDLNEFIKNNKQ